MKPFVLAAVAATLIALPAATAAGQTIRDQSYEQRRERLLSELEQTQERLADLRQQRVRLQARIESVIARMMEERAEALLLSGEQDALQQLDAMLTSAQDNLLAQRDRFASLADAVRRREGSAIAVMLRVDTGATATVESAALTVDGVPVEQRTYSAAANEALGLGAVDQLYRADVLPTDHVVTLTVTVNGRQLSQTVNVQAAKDAATYVAFTVRDGQLVPATWTSRATTPF